MFFVFFTNHLKDKTLKNTNCRMPSGNPRQICAHYVKPFPSFKNILEAFRIS